MKPFLMLKSLAWTAAIVVGVGLVMMGFGSPPGTSLAIIINQVLGAVILAVVLARLHSIAARPPEPDHDEAGDTHLKMGAGERDPTIDDPALRRFMAGTATARPGQGGRGFASMDPDRQREIANALGKAIADGAERRHVIHADKRGT